MRGARGRVNERPYVCVLQLEKDGEDYSTQKERMVMEEIGHGQIGLFRSGDKGTTDAMCKNQLFGIIWNADRCVQQLYAEGVLQMDEETVLLVDTDYRRTQKGVHASKEEVAEV